MLHKLQEDARLDAPEQQINIHLESGLQLNGWADMLQRALDNLLRNALRFNPAAQPIEISACKQAGHLELSIRDHGPGTAAEHLTRLGEPFFRAPGQTSSGHGLGLAIARRAAERHGGQLELNNHAQGGFVATLRLPLTQPQQPAAKP
jgi:signal transduction histidine kinase